MLLTQKMVQNELNSLDLTNKSQKNRYPMMSLLLDTMERYDIQAVESRQDVFNLGQGMEGLVKAIYHDYKVGYFARCNSKDFELKRGSYEIKTSPSIYSLCTPVTKAQRIVFISMNGAYLISKAEVQDILDNPFEYEVKIESNGSVRFKPNLINQVGKPLKWLNDVLGF